MVGYSDALCHLKNEQVKFHYSDVSTIQIPYVYQIPTVHISSLSQGWKYERTTCLCRTSDPASTAQKIDDQNFES